MCPFFTLKFASLFRMNPNRRSCFPSRLKIFTSTRFRHFVTACLSTFYPMFSWFCSTFFCSVFYLENTQHNGLWVSQNIVSFSAEPTSRTMTTASKLKNFALFKSLSSSVKLFLFPFKRHKFWRQTTRLSFGHGPRKTLIDRWLEEQQP